MYSYKTGAVQTNAVFCVVSNKVYFIISGGRHNENKRRESAGA